MFDEFDCIVAVELFHDIELSIFIFFVLEDMFHGEYLFILDVLDLG